MRYISMHSYLSSAAGALVDRNEDAVAELPVDGFREVALACGVLDQNDLAGADDPALAIARRDLDSRIEVDDVLAAGRRMPVEIIGGRHLAEDDPGGGQALGQLPRARLFGPLDGDIPEVRLPARVGVEIVNAHGRSSSRALDSRGGMVNHA